MVSQTDIAIITSLLGSAAVIIKVVFDRIKNRGLTKTQVARAVEIGVARGIVQTPPPSRPQTPQPSRPQTPPPSRPQTPTLSHDYSSLSLSCWAIIKIYIFRIFGTNRIEAITSMEQTSI
jgi:hypothetical protein